MHPGGGIARLVSCLAANLSVDARKAGWFIDGTVHPCARHFAKCRHSGRRECLRWESTEAGLLPDRFDLLWVPRISLNSLVPLGSGLASFKGFYGTITQQTKTGDSLSGQYGLCQRQGFGGELWG